MKKEGTIELEGVPIVVVGEVVVEIIVGSDGTWENHGLEEEVRLVVACLSVIMLTSKWSTFSNNPTIDGPLIALKRKKGIFMLNAGSVCLLGCLGCLLGLLPGFWLGSCLGPCLLVGLVQSSWVCLGLKAGVLLKAWF